jgi:glycosyltransferase involved in cell wall biosynthesis
MTVFSPAVAILVPCYNEGVAVAAVVRDFRRVLPEARIYVYDNNSSDDTAAQALAAGAVVRRAPLQGKGNVVRRMFSDIDADIYVLVDGDATYDAASAPSMIARLLDEQLDMVVGRRLSQEVTAYRAGHRTGNWLLTECVAQLFGRAFTDILSGYRVFSRRFVKSFPAISAGFETETELTVHALQLRMPIDEMDTPYGARPEGSVSKLSTSDSGDDPSPLQGRASLGILRHPFDFIAADIRWLGCTHRAHLVRDRPGSAPSNGCACHWLGIDQCDGHVLWVDP